MPLSKGTLEYQSTENHRQTRILKILPRKQFACIGREQRELIDTK